MGQIRLNSRDVRLLSSLELWGILGIGQLRGIAVGPSCDPRERTRLFFNEITRADCWHWQAKRFATLAGAGLMKTHSYVNHSKLFTLGERGHELLESMGIARFPGFRRSLSEVLVRHELAVASVGLLLAEVFHLPVRTVRERYGWRGRGGWKPAPQRGLSDLWIVDPKAPKAIEVELTQKSQKAYQELWRGYRLRRPDLSVLYLTTWPGASRTLLRYARELEADWIYVCDLQAFRQASGRHPFVGWDGEHRILLEPRPTVHEGGQDYRLPAPVSVARAAAQPGVPTP